MPEQLGCANDKTSHRGGTGKMKIRVLGCHGSQLPGFNTTSFLINGNILLDAGSVTSVLTIEEQINIDYIFVTHPHIDHVRDVMFLADNIFYTKGKESPLVVISTSHVIEIFKKHLFNGVVWPDFSVIPDKDNPVVKFTEIRQGETISLAGLSVTPIGVSHAVETVSYLVQAKEGAVIFVGDTGPTEEIWQIASKTNGLKAVFVETSFSDAMKDVAYISGHLTPASLKAELKKLGSSLATVYLYHMKLHDLETIKKEVKLLMNRNIRVLKDGQVLKIGTPS